MQLLQQVAKANQPSELQSTSSNVITLSTTPTIGTVTTAPFQTLVTDGGNTIVTTSIPVQVCCLVTSKLAVIYLLMRPGPNVFASDS